MEYVEGARGRSKASGGGGARCEGMRESLECASLTFDSLSQAHTHTSRRFSFVSALYACTHCFLFAGSFCA